MDSAAILTTSFGWSNFSGFSDRVLPGYAFICMALKLICQGITGVAGQLDVLSCGCGVKCSYE